MRQHHTHSGEAVQEYANNIARRRTRLFTAKSQVIGDDTESGRMYQRWKGSAD